MFTIHALYILTFVFCSAQLNMSYMEKLCRNKIIIIIIL